MKFLVIAIIIFLCWFLITTYKKWKNSVQDGESNYLQTFWEIMRWRLFGELRIFTWIFGLVSVIYVTIVVIIMIVIIHFILKFW